MKIIPYLIKNVIQEAKAQVNIGNLGVTMCYLGTADLTSSVLKFLQWFLYLISPLFGLVFAILHSRRLLKRKQFSLYYAIYKSFLRVIIMFIIFSAITFIILIIYYPTDIAPSDVSLTEAFAVIISIVFILISVFTGFGYLIFSFRNRVFLKLGLSYIFVVPSVYIFLKVLLCNFVPSLNKYLPPDAIISKKKQLRDQLIDEGKIPSDTEKKL